MFKTVILRRIWDGEIPQAANIFETMKLIQKGYPICTEFEYSIDLPFPPYKGLCVVDQKNDYQFSSGEILIVTWRNYLNQFDCRVEDSAPGIRFGFHYSYQWHIDHAFKSGWQRVDS